MGILDWFTQPRRQSRASRHVVPGMVAYYWDGDTPKEHVVKDISESGMYLYTTERWYEGTIMKLSLRKGEANAKGPCLSVRGRIIRHVADGVGIQFMMRTKDEERN